MRILYGVTGCGLGHTMRARALAEHLEACGHTLTLAASGRAVAILRGHGFDVLSIDGMRMEFERGAVRRARSLAGLLRAAPSALARNARVGLGALAERRPEVLVTDFDSFTATLGALADLPVVSVDHQHVLDRFRHPRAVSGAVSSFEVARAVVRAKTPRCAHYVVTSFFFPEPRWGRTTLVGPVMRPEIEAVRASEGEHVLVYQTAAGDERTVEALRQVRGVKFVVYGLGREARLGNVELRAFDEPRFIAELASARAVICNGGFTTLSEAVYLGKPALSVPLAGQPEQELNAAWLAALGLGSSAVRLDAPTVRRFLAKLPAGPVRDGRIRTGTADAKAALDRALAEAA